MSKKVRVRYAPSPTGLLHIGNARTALFNYLFAKHYGGDFIIRIEDTDVARNVKDGERQQLYYLDWLGLSWEEGPDKGGPHAPYHQLKRLDLYKEYAEKLVEMGHAYKEYNEKDKTKYAIRAKSPKDEEYAFNDLIRGTISFQSKDIEDWVMVKENGIPTYNFAVVIDDHLMEITHVLRGEEHITNTPKQIMIYRFFGWDVPQFGHMTIIVNENNKKLSKRDTSIVQFIGQYDELGYLPAALLNFISFLGFSPKENKEILSKEEIIRAFTPDRLSKAPSMFDVKKLNFINKKYIEKLPIPELAKMAKYQFDKAKIEIPSETWLNSITKLFQNRMHYVAEIVEFHKEFFSEKYKLSKEAIESLKEFETAKPLLEHFLKELKTIEYTPENIKALVENSGKSLDIKGKNLYMPIRIATTGLEHGPSLEDNLYLLGKEEIVSRLEKVLKELK